MVKRGAWTQRPKRPRGSAAPCRYGALLKMKLEVGDPGLSKVFFVSFSLIKVRFEVYSLWSWLYTIVSRYSTQVSVSEMLSEARLRELRVDEEERQRLLLTRRKRRPKDVSGRGSSPKRLLWPAF